MIISDTAIKNRTSVLVLALIILGIGIYSYMVLPRESISSGVSNSPGTFS